MDETRMVQLMFAAWKGPIDEVDKARLRRAAALIAGEMKDEAADPPDVEESLAQISEHLGTISRNLAEMRKTFPLVAFPPSKENAIVEAINRLTKRLDKCIPVDTAQ